MPIIVCKNCGSIVDVKITEGKPKFICPKCGSIKDIVVLDKYYTVSIDGGTYISAKQLSKELKIPIKKVIELCIHFSKSNKDKFIEYVKQRLKKK